MNRHVRIAVDARKLRKVQFNTTISGEAKDGLLKYAAANALNPSLVVEVAVRAYIEKDQPEILKAEEAIAAPVPPKERVRIALDGLLAERDEVAHWELLKVRGMGVLKKDLVGLIEELGEYDKVWITAEDGKDAGYGWKRKTQGLAV